MFCPACRYEYVQGITVCPDCQTALVDKLPEPAGKTAKNAYFVRLWTGADPSRKSEICAALQEQGIPWRDVLREDMFPTAAMGDIEIWVPQSRLVEAREIVGEDEAAGDEAESLAEAGAFELSSDESEEAEESESATRTEPWFPEDATVEVWTGKNARLASGIRASLSELRIASRTDPSEPADPKGDALQRIFVLPKDERRAKAIVRQILDAAPPE
jgi:hypothetical protein